MANWAIVTVTRTTVRTFLVENQVNASCAKARAEDAFRAAETQNAALPNFVKTLDAEESITSNVQSCNY